MNLKFHRTFTSESNVTSKAELAVPNKRLNGKKNNNNKYIKAFKHFSSSFWSHCDIMRP